MNILVTGAKGFVGRNLCENLKNIRDGKNRTRPALNITDIFERILPQLQPERHQRFGDALRGFRVISGLSGGTHR